MAAQLRGEGYEVTTHPVDISAGSSLKVVPASLYPAWPATWATATRDIEHALAYTPTAELLGLSFLAADKVGESGAAYTLGKRGNALHVQAAATTWGARGTHQLPQPWHHFHSPGPGRDVRPVRRRLPEHDPDLSGRPHGHPGGSADLRPSRSGSLLGSTRAETSQLSRMAAP